MFKQSSLTSRRRFLKTVAQLGTAAALPQLLPGRVLGKDGAAPPSEKITLGGIGIGSQGGGDLGLFLKEPDVQVVAVCDVRKWRREDVKNGVNSTYRNQNCAVYRDLRELLARPDIDAVLVTTKINWHGLASIMAARAGKDVYCEKPCTKSIAESLALAEAFRRAGRVFQAGTQRRNFPNFVFAVELARTGKLGKLREVHAHPMWFGGPPRGPATMELEQPESSKEEFDWDMFLGPTAWQPYRPALFKAGGIESHLGAGITEWGSHTIDLCQWANDADGTAPVEYQPVVKDTMTASYANGVKLVIRMEGWLGLGTCPVRFVGETGWVETGDSLKLAVSSPALLAGREVVRPGDTGRAYHSRHVRDFLDCVKSRAQPRANAEVACWSHVACHAANIANVLRRPLKFDPKNREFLGDEEANRLRGEALRAPWRL